MPSIPPDSRLSALFALTLLATLVAGPGPASAAPGPPDLAAAPPFSIPPAELLAAAGARAAPDGEDVEVLLTEARFSFDEAGRCTYSRHWIYRILDAAGAKSWGGIGIDWEPWHQERPHVRARVITADGAEHPLDPATLSEVSPESDEDGVYQDRRELTGPLPAVTPGAVVEELEVVVDQSPLFAAGTSRRQYLSLGAPVRHAVVVVEAPASLPFRYTTSGVPDGAAVLERPGGGSRLRLDLRDVPADAPYPPGLPPDVPFFPYVAFATGDSWSAVAQSYSALVDRQISDADLGSFAPPEDGTTSQWAAIQDLTATLHREVRYTGVELGEAALVPRSPAEVLARGYGDCKDKATLLVALLRRAGVPAYVALLRAGPGQDVEPELPGIGHMGSFDHAIVFVPGTPALWIDATDPYSPIGELPPGDQGRLALVASPNTRALVRTPVADASVNHEEITKEIRLAERGPGHALETDLYQGAAARELRGVWAAAADQIAAKMAETTSRFEVEADDLEKPLRLVSEDESAAGTASTLADAVVVLFRSSVLERVPPELKDAEGKPRRAPYQVDEPHAVILGFRIEPPPGFALTELPADEDRAVGPASFAARFARDGEEVRATLTFTLDRRRLSAEELDALREAVVELAGEKPIVVHYDQVGFAALQAGRVADALAEYRRLAALHPKEALHQVQLADALLAGGLGTEARATARRATELEPGSAFAFHALGVVLSSDPVGRRFAAGFDREGARAAFAKAVELDPEDRDSHVQLALALEHDAEGERYSPKADLAGAIEEYRKVQDQLAGTAFEDNLYFALFSARRFDELVGLLADHADSANRRQLLTAAEAMTASPEVAIQRAERRSAGDSGERQETLLRAGQQLLALRFYPQAADLISAAARSAPNAAELLKLAGTLRRTRRHEELAPTADTPEGVLQAVLVALATGDSGLPSLAGLLAPRLRKTLEAQPGGEDETLLIEGSRLALQIAADQGLDSGVALDLTLALPWDRSGDDASGYRIRLAPPSPRVPEGMYAYVTKAGAGYRYAGMSAVPHVLGLEVLDLLDRGEPEAARTWLDWIAEAMRPGENHGDPLAENPFHLLWSRGQAADPERMRLAATALLAEDEANEAYLATLAAALRSDPVSGAERTGVLLALVRGYLAADRGAEALPLAEALAADAPTSDTGLALEASALGQLERWNAVVELSRTRPESTTARHIEADALIHEENLDGALAIYRRLDENGRAEAIDYNQLAWYALAAGHADDQTLAWAQRAAELAGYKDYAAMHTLATAYAALGRPADAYRVILQTIELRPGHAPDGPDWYVFGRLAELYGLPDAARRYYAKLEPPADADDGERTVSTWAFAQRRLAALDAGSPREAEATPPR